MRPGFLLAKIYSSLNLFSIGENEANSGGSAKGFANLCPLFDGELTCVEPFVQKLG